MNIKRTKKKMGQCKRIIKMRTVICRDKRRINEKENPRKERKGKRDKLEDKTNGRERKKKEEK